MDNPYLSNKPIGNERNDKFQRYGFAKRIATTMYTSTIWSSSYPQPYKIDFSQDYYKHFTSIFDKDYIEKSI